jgi:4-hydroxyphenylpyruvate dioxygenase
MKPAIATVCSLDATLEAILEDYAAGHVDAVDLWLGHADAFLAGRDPANLKDRLATHGIVPVAASFQGGLLTSQGEARREHWRHFAERLELCRALGCPVLVVAGDAFGPLDAAALGRLRASLVEAGRMAGDAGIRLALEFDARASFPDNLQSAVALVEDVGSPAVGICLDWFHYTCGPSKPLDLGLLTNATLAHVQLSDIADVPREMAADADRILPGEGASPADELVHRLRAISYAGGVAIEAPNPRFWGIPPRQFGEIAITALRRLLGQAAM